jgi:hypothetical protein
MGRILADAPRETIVTPTEMTTTIASIQVKRPGLDPKPVVVTYTLADALQAGSLDDEQGRDFHRRHPADCLWAACVRRVASRLFPHLTMGGTTVADVARGAARPPDVTAELDQIEGR